MSPGNKNTHHVEKPTLHRTFELGSPSFQNLGHGMCLFEGLKSEPHFSHMVNVNEVETLTLL